MCTSLSGEYTYARTPTTPKGPIAPSLTAGSFAHSVLTPQAHCHLPYVHHGLINTHPLASKNKMAIILEVRTLGHILLTASLGDGTCPVDAGWRMWERV